MRTGTVTSQMTRHCFLFGYHSLIDISPVIVRLSRGSMGLGAGGMGEVNKARDTRLDRTVAINRSFA